jgi:tryptophan synthase beta subunit
LKAKHHTRSSPHTLAKVIELAPKRARDLLLMLNLSGSGDKDIDFVADHLGGMLSSFYSQSAIS